jgi:hypothetical protein
MSLLRCLNKKERKSGEEPFALEKNLVLWTEAKLLAEATVARCGDWSGYRTIGTPGREAM